MPDIEKKSKDADQTILTPLISLDTPGKATVEVVILADPVSTLWLVFMIRLGINVALTHLIRSYRDSETNENWEMKQEGKTIGKRTMTTPTQEE